MKINYSKIIIEGYPLASYLAELHWKEKEVTRIYQQKCGILMIMEQLQVEVNILRQKVHYCSNDSQLIRSEISHFSDAISRENSYQHVAHAQTHKMHDNVSDYESTGEEDLPYYSHYQTTAPNAAHRMCLNKEYQHSNIASNIQSKKSSPCDECEQNFNTTLGSLCAIQNERKLMTIITNRGPTKRVMRDDAGKSNKRRNTITNSCPMDEDDSCIEELLLKDAKRLNKYRVSEDVSNIGYYR